MVNGGEDREPGDGEIAGASLLVDGLTTLGQIRDLLATRWGAKKLRRISRPRKKAPRA